MTDELLITNCRLFDGDDGRQRSCILIEDGVIREIGGVDAAGHDNILDGQGFVIAPGLIDVHIQGAGGSDVLDGSIEALEAISQTSARFGATGFLATTVFKPNEANEHLTLASRHVGRDLGGAELLGIHLEGPFISPEKRGMIQPECICRPSGKILDEILDMTGGHLRIMTIAPELADCAAIIGHLADSNVVPSFGHSNATYEETVGGFEAGISHVTHLFNAMPSIHHRSPGPLVAIFGAKQITVQLIADGVHIHPSVLQLAFETLGADRIIPITDGMQALGLGDGKYVYNGVKYESRDGTARYKDGTLIGTALGMSQLLAKFAAFTNCPFEVAIKTASENPARLLGLEERKGSIEVGKDADLILLDDNHSVQSTIVAGKIVFTK